MSEPDDDDRLALQQASLQILRRRRFIHVDPAVSSKDLLFGGLVGGILNAVWAFTVPDESIAWFIAMPLVLLSLGYAVVGLLEVRRSRALEERLSARDRPDRSRHHGKPM